MAVLWWPARTLLLGATLCAGAKIDADGMILGHESSLRSGQDVAFGRRQGVDDKLSALPPTQGQCAALLDGTHGYAYDDPVHHLEGEHGQTVCSIEMFLGDCHGTGFAYLYQSSMAMAAQCEYHGGIPTFNWRGGSDEFMPTSNGTNFWNWWFEPVNEDKLAGAKSVVCLSGTMFNEGTSEGLLSFASPYHLDPEPMAFLENVNSKYGRPVKSIRDRVDTFYDTHLRGHNVLAVQVRGGDKREYQTAEDEPMLETPNAGEFGLVLSLGDWVRAAEKVWREMKEPKKVRSLLLHALPRAPCAAVPRRTSPPLPPPHF
jgi:hypothetical protein